MVLCYNPLKWQISDWILNTVTRRRLKMAFLFCLTEKRCTIPIPSTKLAVLLHSVRTCLVRGNQDSCAASVPGEIVGKAQETKSCVLSWFHPVVRFCAMNSLAFSWWKVPNPYKCHFCCVSVDKHPPRNAVAFTMQDAHNGHFSRFHCAVSAWDDFPSVQMHRCDEAEFCPSLYECSQSETVRLNPLWMSSSTLRFTRLLGYVWSSVCRSENYRKFLAFSSKRKRRLKTIFTSSPSGYFGCRTASINFGGLCLHFVQPCMHPYFLREPTVCSIVGSLLRGLLFFRQLASFNLVTK